MTQDFKIKKSLKNVGIIFIIYLLVFGLCSIVWNNFFLNNFKIIAPSIAVIIFFNIFFVLLRQKTNDNIFGEIGFIYLLFAVVYTLAPAYGFLTLENLSAGSGFQNLALLLPEPGELGRHLWRHFYFIVSIGVGYLYFRGRSVPKANLSEDNIGPEKRIIPVLLAMVVISVILLSILSAPVKTYIDNYTRYDHLPWLARRLVTFCVVAKMGGSFILLTIMFKYYNDFRLHIWCFIVFMAVYEIKNSFGSRIEAFFLILSAALLYHYYVKRLSLKKSFAIIIILGGLFSAIEVLRSSDFNLSASKGSITQRQGMPAGELGAVYFTSFHLYSERNNGVMPPVEWPVFFNDFISLVPFVDQTRWHPMFWYAKQYFPESVVPPQTLGPIADSAMWGGEIDLVIRGLINGMLFASLMKWFARKGHHWQVTSIYAFCYATCIMCLKYSIFYHLTPVVKIILPVMLGVMYMIKLITVPKYSSMKDFT